VAVRVYATDDRDRDRLARLYRWLLVRDPQNDRAGLTIESAAEHEMLAMVAAARAGGRVPEPIVAYPIPNAQGALVAWIDVGGQTLDLVQPEEVSDATLADLWHSISRLHDHRLAHRQLRIDNITVDDSGRAWLTGLVLAELGATDGQLAIDVAELLASLAVHLGADRTVPSAVAGVGAPAVAAAAAYLQPLALTAPTRGAVRLRPPANCPPGARVGTAQASAGGATQPVHRPEDGGGPDDRRAGCQA
jgi:undecaprenyl-diphosphatase